MIQQRAVFEASGSELGVCWYLVLAGRVWPNLRAGVPLNWKLPGNPWSSCWGRRGWDTLVVGSGPASSSCPHPRLLQSRVEPHRFFLSSGAGIRGFPVSSVPLQGSTSPVASSSDGEGWVCEQERVPWVRSVCPATTGPTGLPEPPPGSSLLAGNLLFPSRQQVIEGDTGDAGPDGLNPLIALLGIGG